MRTVCDKVDGPTHNLHKQVMSDTIMGIILTGFHPKFLFRVEGGKAPCPLSITIDSNFVLWGNRTSFNLVVSIIDSLRGDN